MTGHLVHSPSTGHLLYNAAGHLVFCPSEPPAECECCTASQDDVVLALSAAPANDGCTGCSAWTASIVSTLTRTSAGSCNWLSPAVKTGSGVTASPCDEWILWTLLFGCDFFSSYIQLEARRGPTLTSPFTLPVVATFIKNLDPGPYDCTASHVLTLDSSNDPACDWAGIQATLNP